SAVALGDVCLIIERERGVQESFPLSSANEFSSRPILVASKTDIDITKQSVRLAQGVSLPGAVLLRMTVAIACWYLRHASSNAAPRDDFHRALDDTATFSTLIERERTSRRLRNDDIAVVKLVLSEL